MKRVVLLPGIEIVLLIGRTRHRLGG